MANSQDQTNEAQQEPVAWMYEWTTPEGEFIQGMTTDDLSSLKDPIGKITNIRPLYFANSESTADVAVYEAFEKFGEPTAFICQGNLYWGTDIDPHCKADHIPLYVRPQAREWQGLTDEDLIECERLADICHRKHMGSIRGQQLSPADQFLWHYARAIEAKLREKNT